ncbi:hypothetical protein MUK60_00355 [Streptomyces sp. LRE541]|uniref:hypothetical protein n=1 Tax=Streptomyces sp. LRE541 TaxID=2931983 RepID=UPI0020106701|nr:hypothetical protein [Streptomyces sp. LRE541]UPZ26402.1 hypothetical protein MUK60_00355 [Streptomyces sp. LRE541]
MFGGVLDDLFEGEDAADTDVNLVGAEAFEGFGETVGDLAAPGEAVGAGRVEQGDASAERGRERDHGGTQAGHESRRPLLRLYLVDGIGANDVRAPPDQPRQHHE